MVFDAISTGAAPVSPAIKKTLTATKFSTVNAEVIGSSPISYIVRVAQVDRARKISVLLKKLIYNYFITIRWNITYKF